MLTEPESCTFVKLARFVALKWFIHTDNTHSSETDSEENSEDHEDCHRQFNWRTEKLKVVLSS
jgi:hypothetical protein